MLLIPRLPNSLGGIVRRSGFRVPRIALAAVIVVISASCSSSGSKASSATTSLRMPSTTQSVATSSGPQVAAGTLSTRLDYSSTGQAAWTGSCNLTTSHAQSPIDLPVEAAPPTSMSTLHFNFVAADPVKVTKSDHDIVITPTASNTVTYSGRTYHLLQVHFHAPSEHHIGATGYPAEAHFVFASAGSTTPALVIAQFLATSTTAPTNTGWGEFVKAVSSVTPLAAGAIKQATGFTWLAMTGDPSKTRYEYPGSLTTPPCTEGIQWVVFKKPIELSTSQLSTVTTAMGENTNRALQTLNGRTVNFYTG